MRTAAEHTIGRMGYRAGARKAGRQAGREAGGEAGGGVGAAAVAATYVSTVVGAGFASGQEVLRFFTHFGPWGLVGLTAAALLLTAGGTAVLVESRVCRASSHADLLFWLAGPRLGRLYDGFTMVFLFGTTAVMVAGSGALFQERLSLPSLVGDLVMALAAVVTVLGGIRGVVAASEVVAPLLLGSVVVAALAAVWGPGGAGPPADLIREGLWRVWSRPEEAAAPSWTLACVLYASYNLALAPAVLAPLGVRARSRAAVVAGGAIGGLVLGAAVACVDVALLACLPESAAYEVPLLYVASRLGGGLGRALGTVLGLALWGEIYTTAVGLLYGLAVRLGRGAGPLGREAEGPRFKRWVLALGLGAALAARAGFSRMVTTLYPVVGYVGLGFLALVLARLGRAWRQPEGR